MLEKMNDKCISAIQELLLFVNDRIQGYSKAVKEAKDAHIKSFCESHATQAQRFADDLNGFLGPEGVKTEKSGTIKGSLYRQWMDAKAVLTNSDDDAIINSCLYGEEWALKAYDDCLDCEDLPVNVRTKVVSQRSSVQEAYDELKEMHTMHEH